VLKNKIITPYSVEVIFLGIEIVIDLAKNQRSEVLIHGKNGRIRERNTYGSDPYPPKG